MLFKMAWRNLWRKAGRTAITMTSIFFAVIIAVFMRSTQEGVYDLMIDNTVKFYRGYVQVHQNGYWDEQYIDNTLFNEVGLEETILAHPDVKLLVPRLESPMMASTGPNSRFCQLVGFDPEREDALVKLKSKLIEGEYLGPDDRGIMVGHLLAEKMKLQIGDTLILLGQGYQGQQSYDQYPIKGLLKFGSPEQNKRMVYLPLKEAQYLLSAPDRLTAFAMDVTNRRVTDKVVADLETKLDTGTYEVMDWKVMDKDLLSFIEADRAGGVVTMYILYVIIAFGIFGTALMMVSERQYEFGVQIAIGMKKRQLAFVLLLEMVFMALMSVLAGSLFGIPMQHYFNRNPIYLGDDMAQVYEAFNIEAILPLSTDPGILIDQGTTVLFMTFVIMIYPLYKVFKVKPIEAMRA
ncbi:MAG: FtsX-like permease family protein [Bacteroidia bacterium]|nr:FtsX-like permease family protein [Bacteroidia bacterium]